MEQPILRLGLLGLAEEEERGILRCAAQVQSGWPLWKAGDPHRADAWMIGSASVDVTGRDGLVIAHPVGSGKRLTLNRAEVDRPLAFTSPLPEGFASAESFDPADEKSVRQRLQRFEAWLRPLRTQFALGSQLIERIAQYKSGVVHVTHDDKLLAVLDFDRWTAGVHIPARPVDLAMAEWAPSPEQSRDMPPSFIRLSLHRVMWTYAVRTTRDLLPARYRKSTLYLRRVPRLPPAWIGDLHLAIMRELVVRPSTLDELVVRMGCDAAELAHHLASLYCAGGLTADPESARRAEVQARRELVTLHLRESSSGARTSSRAAEIEDSGDSEPGVPSNLFRDSTYSPLHAVPE